MADCGDISWGGFQPLSGLKFKTEDFCETLDGGQSFRWERVKDSADIEYVGVFGGNVARVKIDGKGAVFAAFPKVADADSARAALEEYLDMRTDYADIRKKLADTRDPIMLKALEIHSSLRILRQDPAEATICFICSSSKRIIQIKQCVRLLAEKLGQNICGGYHKLPDFEHLAAASDETLKDCKLGYRAAYLKKASAKVNADAFSAMSLRDIPYPDAKNYLKSLHGIGDKVADCILLFGASRFEAFPVDTWIKQAMADLYNTGTDEKKIRAFAAEKFGKHAGFAQQLIFAAKRKGLI